MTPLLVGMVLALVAVAALLVGIGRSLPEAPRNVSGGARAYFDPDPWGVGRVQSHGDPPVHRVLRPDELFAPGHLQGMEDIGALMRQLAHRVVAAQQVPPYRPRRPTSILLTGPPGRAMTVLVHQLARRFGADLVEIDALYALPTSNGGSQRRIAPAVHHARAHLPSIVLIRDLEQVSSPAVRDPARRRAAHDLLNETLREIYGVAHVVVAMYTMRHEQSVPRVVRQRFDHGVHVDVPVLERALRASQRELPSRWRDAA